MRLLVIEDDRRIADFVAQGLRESGYGVAVARDGGEGYLDALLNDYDLLVLGLMLPGMDGIAIARKLRAARKTTPIPMLTARDSEKDKILRRKLDAPFDTPLIQTVRGVGYSLRRESPSCSAPPACA